MSPPTLSTVKKKSVLGVQWLENVSVFEISQHVNLTLQGNYCKIISICVHLLQLHTEMGLRGWLTSQEPWAQIVFRFLIYIWVAWSEAEFSLVSQFHFCYIWVIVHLGDCHVITKSQVPKNKSVIDRVPSGLGALESPEYHGVWGSSCRHAKFGNFRSGGIGIHKEE